MLRFLHREQFIPAPLGEVWDYFATPRNLDELTPPTLRFEIVGEPAPGMYAGQLIAYRISPVRGVWLRWLTEIRQVRVGSYFVDEQRHGPYRLWYHEHHFAAVPGGVHMIDHVTYDVGWGLAGAVVERLWVRGRLREIFDYRAQRVAARFLPT